MTGETDERFLLARYDQLTDADRRLDGVVRGTFYGSLFLVVSLVVVTSLFDFPRVLGVPVGGLLYLLAAVPTVAMARWTWQSVLERRAVADQRAAVVAALADGGPDGVDAMFPDGERLEITDDDRLVEELLLAYYVGVAGLLALVGLGQIVGTAL